MVLSSATRLPRSVKAARALLAAALLSALLVAATQAPADAATSSGSIAIKRSGTSLYTGLAGPVRPAGDTVTYSLRIRNTGTEVDQFHVKATYNDFAAVARTYKYGRTDVTAQFATANGYLTPALAPGKSILVSYFERVAADAAPSPAHNAAGVVDFRLRDLQGNDVGAPRATAAALLESPASGTAWDALARSGYGQFTSHPDTAILVGDGINPNQGSTFTVRLQNNSSSPNSIGLKTAGFCPAPAWAYKVSDGFSNVTAATDAGTYRTRTLQPGQHRDLRIRVVNTGECDSDTGGIVFAYVLTEQGAQLSQVHLFAVAARP